MIPAKLIIIEGEQGGEVFHLNGDCCTIGRSPDCTIHLTDYDVSRLHARIECAYGRYSLIDEGSTNGTFVNEKLVTEPVVLNHDDRIRLASTVLARFEDPNATPPVTLRMFQGILFDDSRREVVVNGRTVDPPLSASQYSLLQVLVRNRGRFVSHEEIAGAVWPDQQHITPEMIHTQVARLRKALADYGADQFIVTRRGMGYMYITPQEQNPQSL
ncbi:MAG: winged helix-turn-helix domain-containing protein [Anaerolineae bacterium]